MKQKPKHKMKHVVFAVIFLTSLWGLPILQMNKYPVFHDMIEIQTASAETEHDGILGQLAPELELNTWIDGDGKETESINLKDYRGKIVYLYFFQDW